ncbi:MAG TPA: multicopper oxidase [Candidatus Aquilonibacter sp.]|jgi:spore coat protein A|nr:multicopper oxidase [Candidatus Aquilonibacter sp.]
MAITRRNFLQQSSLLAATLSAGKSSLLHAMAMSHGNTTMPAAIDVNTLAQFVDPLPIPEIAKHEGLRPSPSDPKRSVPFYRIKAQAIASKVHRDLPPTKFWSFGPSAPGPTFETRSGEPLLVEWANALPNEHFLPVDQTIHGAEADKPTVRTVVHVHGAKTGPESDGYPEDWIAPGKSSLYYYPNEQDAAMLWYHDHTLGINRLNVYAGLLGTFFVRDAVEDALNLPQGKYELPLILYDRWLTKEGQLVYPVSTDPQSPWVPEVFGNAILVNGKLFPYAEVEPRKYRLRVLNGSNARTYHLAFANDKDATANAAQFHQIGTDQGLLPAPVPLTKLEIAPGERADLVVDFSEHRGAQLILKSDAFVVMQFRVTSAKVTDTSSLPATLRPVPKIPESQASQTRLLTLDEYITKSGNPAMLLLNASHWKMPITEKPVLGSTEIWTLINPTNDTHPIHLHLVRFQILDRQPYEPWLYQTKRQLHFMGPPEPPAPEEAGWKDTVRAHSRMVTRIIVPFAGFTGRYVWHCHILEHEDNEMMRPYEVIAADNPGRT